MSLKIKNARYGITSGGMACGPIFGHVIAEVELVDTETGETCFYLEFCQKTPSITMGGDEWLF